jgi:hypothetical protein
VGVLHWSELVQDVTSNFPLKNRKFQNQFKQGKHVARDKAVLVSDFEIIIRDEACQHVATDKTAFVSDFQRIVRVEES